MLARILDKSEEDKWLEFVNNHPFGTIHQTPCWGKFQAKIPSREKYWIVVLEKDEEIMGGTMIIKHRLPLKYCWLYASRGPLLDYNNLPEEELKFQAGKLTKKIEELAKQQKAIFLRVDPPIILPSDTEEKTSPSLPFSGFKPTKHGFHPQNTLMIDLTQTEEKILKQMKPKGRYNIRLAEKKEVQIHEANTQDPKLFQKDLDDFYKILEETTRRDNFRPHNKEYYLNMLESLQPHSEALDATTKAQQQNPRIPQATTKATQTNRKTPQSTTDPQQNPKIPQSTTAPPRLYHSTAPTASLYLAKHKGKTIAGIIATFYKDTAIYYYGASSNEDRNLMAPYLLQWHAILEAKSRGCKHYDFLGISPPETTDDASQNSSSKSKLATLQDKSSKSASPQLSITPKTNKKPHNSSSKSTSPHPWHGVTKFKKKFGGTPITYISAEEYSFKKLLYLAYKLYKKRK